jgi:hypothetical protein
LGKLILNPVCDPSWVWDSLLNQILEYEMSLYAVMEPIVEYGTCHWVRRGAPTQNLFTADKVARRRQGRVIDLNNFEVVADFWVEPEPEVKLPSREYRQARAMACLFD